MIHDMNGVDPGAQQQRYGTARAVFLSTLRKLGVSERAESIYSMEVMTVKIRLYERARKPLPFGNVVRLFFSVMLTYECLGSCHLCSIGDSTRRLARKYTRGDAAGAMAMRWHRSFQGSVPRVRSIGSYSPLEPYNL